MPGDGSWFGDARTGGVACHPKLPTASGESLCVSSLAAAGHACGPGSPRSPQLNGKVERSHQGLIDELFVNLTMPRYAGRPSAPHQPPPVPAATGRVPQRRRAGGAPVASHGPDDAIPSLAARPLTSQATSGSWERGALVHGSRALGEPRSTSWPSWRQQVHDLDMKSRVHPQYKTQYHVGNWPAYDRALVQRGDITVWLAPDAIATWEAVGVGKRGGQRQYSDLTIETALTLRLIFHLPLRQTEGFLTSIFGLLGLELSAPDHTTLSRRGGCPADSRKSAATVHSRYPAFSISARAPSSSSR